MMHGILAAWWLWAVPLAFAAAGTLFEHLHCESDRRHVVRGQTISILGAEPGACLSENLGRHTTLGPGWGQTLTSALPAIVPRQAEGIRVLSLLGGLTRVSSVNPSGFAWRMADRLNAKRLAVTSGCLPRHA